MKNVLKKICLPLGICLLVAAVALPLLWQWNIKTSQQRSAAIVQTLRTLLPSVRDAVPEERRDNTMSALSLESTDFAGILEMPRYGASMPVCATWGEVGKYPCRFTGSVYDRTLQLGATTQAGQFDFYREISVGDTVCFTDAEGNRYTYAVTALRYAQHADQQALQREPADLTLFVKNIYGFEYLIISCTVPQ